MKNFMLVVVVLVVTFYDVDAAPNAGYLRLLRQAYCTHDPDMEAKINECQKDESAELMNIRHDCAKEVGGAGISKWEDLEAEGCKDGSEVPLKLSTCMNNKILTFSADDQYIFDNVHICMFKATAV